jgi:hypothetical protein
MTERPENVGTIAEFEDLARHKTGLDDFGGDDYREGLEVLIRSYDTDAALTERGLLIARKQILAVLTGRLKSQRGFAEHPEHVDVPVEAPIFVSGIARTGTTATQRLLSADPAHQGLEMWLAESPQLRPRPDELAANADFVRSDAYYRARQSAEAEFMKVHFMGAQEADECWRLVQQTGLSISFVCTAYLPSYTEWLTRQDWTPAYERYKKNLQLIGMHDTDKRWALKSPSHVFAVDAIMKVFPDALFVRTFRDPQTSMASTFSLAEQGSAGMSKAFDRATIGRSQFDLWAAGSESFQRARRQYDDRQFFDLDYRHFVADPVAAIASIYEQFGLPFDAAARTAVEAAHQESLGSHRAPSHRYDLADFGVPAEEIDARFAAIAAL